MNDTYSKWYSKFILYADDTTLSSPMCSFTRGCNGNIDIAGTLINSELNKIADWLAVNKLSLNVQKTKFMTFHNRQRVITENDIPCHWNWAGYRGQFSAINSEWIYELELVHTKNCQ